MVIDYLKRFTFLSKEEIDAIEEKHKVAPEKRDAHKALAYEVVKFLHGEEAANKAKEMSESLFGKFQNHIIPSDNVRRVRTNRTRQN